MKEKQIKYGVIAILALLLLILIIIIFTVFRKDKHSDLAKQLIESQNELLSIRQEIIEEKKEENRSLRAENRKLEISDSITKVRYIEGQKIYKSLDAQLKNIPININRIAGNDDSIRAAFAKP